VKAFWIRSDIQKIQPVEYLGLPDLQHMVGGLITHAHQFTNKDTVFVDDEGMMKGHFAFFVIVGGHQPFAGNGVVVGRERRNSSRTFEPRTTLEELEKVIRFCNVAEIRREHGNA
jgi:Domain of unknown function (DUF3846)